MRLPGLEMPWKEFLTGLKDKIAKDSVTDMAAGVTYYEAAALFPFLLFLVSLAALVIAPSDAEKIVQQLAQVAPGPVTQILGDRIRELTSGGQRLTLLGFGAVGALWAASGAVTALMRALNRAYDVVEGRPFWKVRLIALGMTIVSAVLSLAAALVGVAATPLEQRFGGPIGLAIGWLRLPAAGVVGDRAGRAGHRLAKSQAETGMEPATAATPSGGRTEHSHERRREDREARGCGISHRTTRVRVIRRHREAALDFR